MKKDTVMRLFSQYGNDLYRFALSFVGSKYEAEDIVQDVFVKLISRPFVIRQGTEKSYLLKVTANRCKDYLKSPRYKTHVDIDDYADVIGCSEEYTSDDNSLFNALNQIDEKTRMPIYLHYYEGYSYKEISAILKISESAVAMRISRGKEELKKLLEE